MAPLVEVANVSKKFLIKQNPSFTIKENVMQRLAGKYDRGRELWALRDVSFSLDTNRLLGIIGHNGAGKSTLLRLLAGLGRPTSGSICLSGNVGTLLELGAGFHGDLTGRQNIMTGGILAGLRKRQVLEKQQEVIEFAELEEFIDQPVRTYSSGMFLRLAFATAILFNPDLLVIDEVISVGDSRFQQKCLDRLQEFRSAGKSIILVSHDLQQIASMCDEVLVLEEGKVMMQANPEAAINCYHDLMRTRTEKRKKLVEETTVPIIVPNANRFGTGEAVIDAVNFYNRHGEPIAALNNGEGIVIEIAYSLNSPLPDMAIGAGIYTHSDVKCFEAAIPSLRTSYGYFSHNSSLRCYLKALPLLPGRYYVNVGLYPTDWSFVYDYHWQMHPLDVKSTKNKDSDVYVSGIIALDHSWLLTSEGNPRNPDEN